MNYQALARKWRPHNFTSVVGQQHVLTALINALKMGNIHHAYLFSGTRGVGKTSIARLLAKSLNCKNNITANPCNQCNNCHEIDKGSFIDLIEIDAASRTKVEDTRDMLESIYYAPAHGRFKIYLIDEVHMLSRHSFNALLKTLEEPPSHVKFLLVTTEPQKLPITILSRCLKFQLKLLEVEEIQKQLNYILQQEKITFECQALCLLANAADGSMRDALSLTDQAILLGRTHVMYETVKQMLGCLDNDQALILIETLVHGQSEQAMALVHEVSLKGIDWEMVLIEMLRLLHTIAMLQLLPSFLNKINHNHRNRLNKLANILSRDDVQFYYQIILMGRKDLSLAPNRKLGVEMTLLRLLSFKPNPQAISAANTEYSKILSKLTPTNTSEEITQLKTLQTNITLDKISYPNSFSDVTNQLIQARKQLLTKKEIRIKCSKTAFLESSTAQVNSTSKNISNIDKYLQKYISKTGVQKLSSEYQNNIDTVPKITAKTLYLSSNYDKYSKIIKWLMKEVHQRDAWAAEITMLSLSKEVQKFALNTWKESNNEKIILHLRSKKQYLNIPSTYQSLKNALSKKIGRDIKLDIVEDDNREVLTPIEWYQIIYEEKLAKANQSIKSDPLVQKIRELFDADLDEENIIPI
ncbi:DNA polymerase III subunit gamma/tau [Pantoea sp. Mhis]|uniref:DNA polymerase III subunit gamma/tau n=1 Tax=Pantoea sp. Mhis TaxID=2576759 RepID=UPI00135C10D9|nr:DNA polymerase III subunit gamma/tau [Pantoea sp. Mhis]MXP56252.1 DNA polymerase III subunit gamma/tau [Pantoea sp. Mhis]